MKIILFCALVALTMSSNAQTANPKARARTRGGPVATGTAKNAPKLKVAANIDEQLAKWKPYRMTMPAGLSAREQQLASKLVEAQQYINAIYWRQSDPEGLALLKRL